MKKNEKQEEIINSNTQEEALNDRQKQTILYTVYYIQAYIN